MADTHTLQELAKAKTREDLRTPAFLSLPPQEQRAMFVERYNQNYADMARAQSAPQQARAFNQPERASDRIDDDRHKNDRIDQAGELAGDFIDNVNFPQFVSDLLKGVFDANLAVQTQQIETYQELLKTATASVAKFVNAIDDTAAFGYLAENNSDEFNIDFSDTDTDDSGQPAAVLTSSDGEPVDIGDNQVKAKIMDAKIAMAKEQRALLREIILMGVTRLVVEDGEVNASVLFDIKASEQINKADKAALKKSASTSRSLSGGGGLLGKIFGGISGGGTRSSRKTEISVASAKSQSSTDLAAKLAGSVKIKFKSDYFKLDNFAEMYGPQANVGGGGGAGSGNPGSQGGGGQSG
jgi:hypothetical protein